MESPIVLCWEVLKICPGIWDQCRGILDRFCGTFLFEIHPLLVPALWFLLLCGFCCVVISAAVWSLPLCGFSHTPTSALGIG